MPDYIALFSAFLLKASTNVAVPFASYELITFSYDQLQLMPSSFLVPIVLIERVTNYDVIYHGLFGFDAIVTDTDHVCDRAHDLIDYDGAFFKHYDGFGQNYDAQRAHLIGLTPLDDLQRNSFLSQFAMFG
jgi:hypothetical protein